MTILSVEGAQHVPVLPHAALEKWARSTDLSWTFLRPAYFHQNLSGVLAPDVRRGRLQLPAVRSRAYVDAADVAEVAAATLTHPADFAGQALTLTSDQTPTWREVADLLTTGLGREITYQPVSLPRWVVHARNDLGMDLPAALVTGAIHASARLGRSTTTTDVVRQVTNHAPRTLEDFISTGSDSWL